MKMAGNVMYMHEVEGGLEIIPGQKIELNPSGYRLMFMDLRRPHAEWKASALKAHSSTGTSYA